MGAVSDPKPPTPITAAANEALLSHPHLDWDDESSADAARRGFIGKMADPTVTNEAGSVVWDLASYDFLDDPEAPPSVNPSLWRQARLNMEHGLHRVTDGIFQVRGHDLSVITFVRTSDGWIVIDPLISAETARSALELLFEHQGEAPVRAVIYTHSHIDHWGGVLGVISEDDVADGVRVIAPEGFLHAAVSENVLLSAAMPRRATYMYGNLLPRGPLGQVDAGLGKATSGGSVGIIPPTEEISETPTVLMIDDIEIEFQITPGTEAPAEMNFYFPEWRALCMAENCARTLHNTYTPRGAEVRDAKAWAEYLDESIVMFADRTDVLFASHHWPAWGDDCLDYLEKQRDIYRYLHDQTIRMANQGHTMLEIAEEMELPPALDGEWSNRGYYGTVSHDVKAIYQKYLGYFDGNPASLWPLPPEPAAAKFVEYMGGADAVLERARADFDAGNYRWVAQVVNHVVFAEPGHTGARELQADALEQLGYQSESAVWRNFFLSGAQELRYGVVTDAPPPSAGSVVSNIGVANLLDAVGTRINGLRAAEAMLRMNIELHDSGEQFGLWLQHGVLHHRAHYEVPDAQLTIRATRLGFIDLLLQRRPAPEIFEAGEAELDGDAGALLELVGLVDPVDPHFDIVTP